MIALLGLAQRGGAEFALLRVPQRRLDLVGPGRRRAGAQSDDDGRRDNDLKR